MQLLHHVLGRGKLANEEEYMFHSGKYIDKKKPELNDIYLFRVLQHGLGEAGTSWELVSTIYQIKKHLHYNLRTNWLYLTLIFLAFIHSVSKKP